MTGTSALTPKKHLKCNKQMCFVSLLLLLIFAVSPQDERRRVEAVRPAPVNMLNRPCGGGRSPTALEMTGFGDRRRILIPSRNRDVAAH